MTPLTKLQQEARERFKKLFAIVYDDGSVGISPKESLDFLDHEIAVAVEETRETMRFELARLDWIKILDEAIKSRPTSWGKDIVCEWRNASDEVWGAMNREAIKNNIWSDLFANLKETK
jgi:hypothetical protein